MRVLKFGGATVAGPQRILNIARIVAHHVHNGEKIIVVVSAMGKTTSELTALAKAVSPQPHQREMDMLLSVGERITMSLLSMALNDLKIRAVSFTGSQAGIITDDDHENANIIAIRPTRVQQSLDEGKTVIVAGFQGVSEKTKEITTLGRGGSDTTAVALAAHFGCRCEILKEMNSVYTADPRLFKNAKPVSQLSYALLEEMTFWGAKMLNSRAAQVARKHQVELFIGEAILSPKGETTGTTIKNETTITSDEELFINHHMRVMKLTLREPDPNLERKFYNLHLHSPQILLTEENVVWVTDHEDRFELVRKTLNAQAEMQVDPETYSAVSVISSQASHDGLGSGLSQELSAKFQAKVAFSTRADLATTTYFFEQKFLDQVVAALNGM